jgi:hypothetical protein
MSPSLSGCTPPTACFSEPEGTRLSRRCFFATIPCPTLVNETRAPCQKPCAFFSGLPSACSAPWRSPPSRCIAANRSTRCGWSSPPSPPTPSAIASTAVLFRAKVLALDPLRATPAERLDNGRDFIPTNKWVVFGHHFAAIAGPGPLVGPVLAAQFGYLPGTLWIIAGAVLGGCVQDFVILLFSVRRDGKSLTEMAKSEIGPLGGVVAYVAVISIIIILLGATALIVVNALKSSPWGTFTIAMTMPIAVLMGVYLRRLRPGKVLETSILGFVLVLAAIFGGQWVSQSPSWALSSP